MPVIFWKYLFIIVGLYGLLLIFIYLFQKKLIFEPTTIDHEYKFNLDKRGKEVYFNTSDNLTLHAIHYRVEQPKGIILYLHGNASCLTDWYEIAEDLLNLQYDIFIIDYRGYGKSEGGVSESGMYKDAQAAYDYLIKQNYASTDIVIYGMSIGASVALELLNRVNNKARGLVLESPFASLKKLAYEKFPYFLPGLLLQYRFNNLKKAKTIQVPTLIMHGDHDLTTPHQHSQKLHEVIPADKKLVIIPAGSHVDLPDHLEYHLELEKFFKRIEASQSVSTT